MKQSGFGIASLVLGIVGILLSCVGVGIYPAILGIIFAIIGLVSKGRKHGTAIAGLICSIVAAIFFMFAASLVDAIKSSSDEESPKKVETTEQSESEVKTDGEEEQEETENVDNTFTVGEVVEASDLKISFLSAGEYTSDNEFIQPKDGYMYYRMEFEFENISDSDKTVSSMADWNCYADGYKVDQTWLGDDNGLDATLSAGKKTKGAVYFEVPKDAQSIDLEYAINFWTEDKIIFIVK